MGTALNVSDGGAVRRLPTPHIASVSESKRVRVVQTPYIVRVRTSSDARSTHSNTPRTPVHPNTLTNRQA